MISYSKVIHINYNKIEKITIKCINKLYETSPNVKDHGLRQKMSIRVPDKGQAQENSAKEALAGFRFHFPGLRTFVNNRADPL